MRIIKKIIPSIVFLGFYLRELVIANFKIAADLITPGLNIKPGFIKLPLLTETDFEIMLYSNLLTMTPGTFVVDISQDKKSMYIHAMYLQNTEELRDSLIELQHRIFELTR